MFVLSASEPWNNADRTLRDWLPSTDTAEALFDALSIPPTLMAQSSSRVVP
jgi:hypothetical protein